MADDVVLNRVASLERWVARVREEHAGADENLFGSQTRQDSIVLNLQRACEISIDLAMHLVRVRRLGVPQDTRHGFDMLRQAGLLEEGLAGRLQRMVGFRNVAIHDYTRLDLAIVKAIIDRHLGDFLDFGRAALKLAA